MATEIYLGLPPQRVIDWIKSHSKPAEHPETRFTLEDGTVETYDITGTLDTQWMIANGYQDDEGTWLKTITQADIGNTVTIIGDYTFDSCSGLTSVTIPDSVTSIGSSAFYYCSGLTSVTIPDSVTSIGEYAFFNCSRLTSVTIPDSVTSIGDCAFSSCSGLMSISVGSGNVNYKSVNGLLLSKDGKTLIQGVNGDVNIPDGVTSIGTYAFRRCSGLTSVTIPDGVTSIGSHAFDGCSGLTSVTMGNSVTSIGWQAFSGCSGLTSVTIPDSVTSIGEYAFLNCSRLTSVTIPDSVTSIGDCAFRGCSGLTSVTIVANGGNAENVKQMMISAGVSSSITWNMPESATE